MSFSVFCVTVGNRQEQLSRENYFVFDIPHNNVQRSVPVIQLLSIVVLSFTLTPTWNGTEIYYELTI